MPCSALDATFACYLLDCESNTISQPAVYRVLSEVPLVPPQGAVIENPGGELLFGARQQPSLLPAAAGRLAVGAGQQPAQPPVPRFTPRQLRQQQLQQQREQQEPQSEPLLGGGGDLPASEVQLP